MQKPHLPIWIGGDSNAALRRVARLGSGWIVWFRTKPDEIPARLDYIKSQPTWTDRPLDIPYGLGTSRLTTDHAPSADDNSSGGLSAQQIVDALGRFKELGITISSVPM